jgi:uncharacterized protein related to proFAR isomerase
MQIIPVVELKGRLVMHARSGDYCPIDHQKRKRQ